MAFILGKNRIPCTEAAKRLGLTPAYIRQLCNTGSIPAVKFGRRWFLDIEEVEAWIAENKHLNRTRSYADNGVFDGL